MMKYKHALRQNERKFLPHNKLLKKKNILLFTLFWMFSLSSSYSQVCGSFDYIPFVRTGALGSLDANQCVDDIVLDWTTISSTWTADTNNAATLTTGPGTNAGEQVCYTGGTNSWHTIFNNASPLPSDQSGCVSFTIPEDQYDGHFVVGLWDPNGTTWGTAACQIYLEGNTLINSWRVISVLDGLGTAISTGWQTTNWAFPMEMEVCFDGVNQEFYANFDANNDGVMEEVARGDACVCESPAASTQIYPICPTPGGAAGDPIGNPGAIVPITGTLLSPTEYLIQSQELCIQGDGANNGACGEDPEWRLDLAIPAEMLGTCADLSFRVCRRGDFGQSNEDLFIYDELFNEIGLVDGLTGTQFDCTAGPACSQVTISSCAFNDQAVDGIWELTFYTNGNASGNTVGDFCNLPSGPQTDAGADVCGSGICETYTQADAPNGDFESSANGGPMVDAQCDGCNCLFVDYLYIEFQQSDPIFTIPECVFVDDVVDLTPAINGCTQTWSATGGGNISATTGASTYTATTAGMYQICNDVGNDVCLDQLCIDIEVKDIPQTCEDLAGSGFDLCDLITQNPTNPLATLDCDGGGVDNQTECENGLNPNSAADDCSYVESNGIFNQSIKTFGAPTICEILLADPSHSISSQDCDGGGKDNLTECQEGLDPNDPSDDAGPSCEFNFNMSYTFNDQGVCRFFVDLNCDDTACPVSSWDYDISAGSESISGTSTTTLNAPTSNSFRPSILACGGEIRIDREDFATAFPGGFGEDITFTLTANSSSCGCTETATVILPRMRAMTFDNQGPQRDETGTTSWIQANGDYVNGSATPTSSWPMPPPPPTWGVGGPTFIEASYVQSGSLVCQPVGWTQMLASPGLSICELTLDDNTVITLPPGCAVPATGALLATSISAALNVCNTFLNHPSIQGNGLCSSIGTQYDGNLTDGVNACVNWNFMYSTGYAVKTFKICEDATGNVIGEFVFGDASVDYGY